MSDNLAGLLIGAGVLAAIIVAIVIASLRDERDGHRVTSRAARDAVDALIVLDPSLLATFGRKARWDDYPAIGASGDRVLDVNRLRRLAETRRTLTKRATSSAELDRALAELAEARRDTA